MSKPERFEAYWAEVDEALKSTDPGFEFFPAPLRTTEYAMAYDVRMTSPGPYRIFGFYSVPVGQGPFPALLQTPRYGSVNNPPHADDRRRYAVLTLMHRGQRLADSPFSAPYPGLLTLGIDEPEAYIYRSIIADCLRGAEFLIARPEIDKKRLAVAGDDLALITAARRPIFRAVNASALTLYRLAEAAARTDAYPVEEINDYLRGAPGSESRIARTLSYVDPMQHANRILSDVLLQEGDPGAIGGPEWLDPLAHAITGPVERYRLTHEGGTDHDWIDAWLSNKMGVPAQPRLWEAAK